MEMDVRPGIKRWLAMLHTEYSLPSTVGDSVLMVLNMLVSTKNRVTNNPILPGTTEGEIRKLTQETWKKEFGFEIVKCLFLSP